MQARPANDRRLMLVTQDLTLSTIERITRCWSELSELYCLAAACYRREAEHRRQRTKDSHRRRHVRLLSACTNQSCNMSMYC